MNHFTSYKGRETVTDKHVFCVVTGVYHSNSELFCHAAKEEICQSEEPRDRNIKDVSFFGFTTLAELQEKIRYFQELKQYEVWDR